MANIKSAKKRIIIAEKKHDQNRVVRSAVKTRVARVRSLIGGGVVDVGKEIGTAASALDRAAERGILHPNNAARRKSRLMRAAAKAAALAADPEAAARAAAETKAHAKGTGKATKGGRRATGKKS